MIIAITNSQEIKWRGKKFGLGAGNEFLMARPAVHNPTGPAGCRDSSLGAGANLHTQSQQLIREDFIRLYLFTLFNIHRAFSKYTGMENTAQELQRKALSVEWLALLLWNQLLSVQLYLQWAHPLHGPCWSEDAAGLVQPPLPRMLAQVAGSIHRQKMDLNKV